MNIYLDLFVRALVLIGGIILTVYSYNSIKEIETEEKHSIKGKYVNFHKRFNAQSHGRSFIYGLGIIVFAIIAIIVRLLNIE